MGENDFREPSDHGALARYADVVRRLEAAAGERSTWMGSSLWRSTTRH